MGAISAWVFSIAGVAVLTVLVDLVLPNGQTNKYIKGIFSFVMIVIIIAPLPKLINKEWDLSDIFENEEIFIQDDFIYQLNRDKLDSLETLITADCKNKGIDGIEVKISANIFTHDMKIENVFVDLYHLVIMPDKPNINTKDEIKKSIIKFISIEEGKIIFNE